MFRCQDQMGQTMQSTIPCQWKPATQRYVYLFDMDMTVTLLIAQL